MPTTGVKRQRENRPTQASQVSFLGEYTEQTEKRHKEDTNRQEQMHGKDKMDMFKGLIDVLKKE